MSNVTSVPNIAANSYIQGAQPPQAAPPPPVKPLDSVGQPEEYIQGAMNAKTETEKAYYQAMLNAAIAKPMIETPPPYQQELQQMGYIPQNQPAQATPQAAPPVVKPQV